MKRMNYLPYIAIALVAFLGYLYINNLTSIIRNLEAKNSALKSEIQTANTVIKSLRTQYVQMSNAYTSYSSEVQLLRSKVERINTEIVRNEKRIDKLAKAHPVLVQNAVNEAVAARLACIVSASKGKDTARVNNEKINCNR